MNSIGGYFKCCSSMIILKFRDDASTQIYLTLVVYATSTTAWICLSINQSTFLSDFLYRNLVYVTRVSALYPDGLKSICN